MLAFRLAAFPRLALLAVLCLLPFLPRLSAQSYVPQFPQFTAASCRDDQTFVQLGYAPESAKNASIFPDNSPGTSLGTYWGPFTPVYVYTTPFTTFTFGATLYQITAALSDNSALQGPMSIRLGLYLFQTPEKNVFDFNFASLLGMTDVITLYPSKEQVLYANLIKPVRLLSEGNYGVAIYANGPLYIVGGQRYSGFSALPEYDFGYNSYQLPPSMQMWDGDKAHPLGAVGCIDKNAYHQPNTTYYAFCALVETYLRQPAGNGNPYLSSMTNTTRYSGVIAVDNTKSQQNSNGLGYPIVFMEGEVQQSTNAGAFQYPPLGITAFPFRYSQNHTQFFPNATDLLYPNASIPIDGTGIVITTSRNQTNLYRTGVANDQTIGSTGQTGIVTKTYFSSFIVLPAEYLDEVVTNCTLPIGYKYVPDYIACDPSAASVQFGDVSPMDTDPFEEDEEFQYLPPNLLSFRLFQVFTPDTTAYQLTYYTFSNPEAIVHMRLGLFRTNTTYVNSFSALPQYELLQMTHEVELVNIDVGLVTANLTSPVKLNMGQLYAIGVWTDSLVYGPSSEWGVDSAGLEMPYTNIDQSGTMPSTVFALGGQSTVQLMGVNACAAQNSLYYFNLCATFAQYYYDPFAGQWFLIKRFYTGTLAALSRPMQNSYGSYHIATAGTGNYSEIWWLVYNPLMPNSSIGPVALNLSGTWTLNNFQVQSPNYFYTSSISGLALDQDGMQMVININNDRDNVVYATIINAVKPRGSPEWVYQESQEQDYQDAYTPAANSAAVFVTAATSDPFPSCPVAYVPWNAVMPPSLPFIVTCTGLAQIQSTYGDNRIFDYVNDQEGNMVDAFTVYTINFTAQVGTIINQVGVDVLNNINITDYVYAQFGLYDANGNYLTSSDRLILFELLDQMIITDLDPPYNITASGTYTIAFQISTRYAIATSNMTGPVQTQSGFGLPRQFQPNGFAPLIALSAYGCVSATHYFCGSFQYYQGDNYSPVTYDYLYQGLVRVHDGPSQTNQYGTYNPVTYGVGHLTLYARIARYPIQFMLGFTDLLLSQPGSGSGDSTINVVYSVSNNNQPLDGNGLTFLTDDDYGYAFSLFFNSSRNTYQDSTNAELGAELLTTVVLRPVNLTVGVPQCSWLDLPPIVTPNMTSNFSCSTEKVMWGDDITDDYFYSEEGLYSNEFNLIVLSPFNTGPEVSTVRELALAINQNGNVFAHIRMALYGSDNLLLAQSNEVAVDNARDAVLYFQLDREVVLKAAAVYYAAYWSDVSFYSTAGQDWNAAKCYYNLTEGYDRQSWPSTIGSVEAEYYTCNPLPVAALGCSTPDVKPPPDPPVCPPTNSTGPTDGKRYSVVTVFVVGFLALALGVILTLLGVKLYNAGSCHRFLGRSGAGDSGPLSSRSEDSGSSRYSSLSDE